MAAAAAAAAARSIMEVLLCPDQPSTTGATVVASVFLTVFACLIVADGALTAWALGRAVGWQGL